MVFTARRLAVAVCLTLCAAPLCSAGNACYRQWLQCMVRPACRDQYKKIMDCVGPSGFFSSSGMGGCVASAFDAGEPLPSLLSWTACAQQLLGVPDVSQSLVVDLPGVSCSKLWPYVYDLTKYSQWTNLVSASCVSPGCDPTQPRPGDLINPSVQALPGQSFVPAFTIPLAQVFEVRGGTKCVSLPGGCSNMDPPYRVQWGPTYPAGPINLWGYQHFFDLYPIKNGTGAETGCRVDNHEFYVGSLSPILMGLLNGKSLLTPTLTEQNKDLEKFALANADLKI